MVGAGQTAIEATPAADPAATAPDRAKTGRWGWFSRILAALGVLQAYNIVSRSQEVVSLSQSVHLVAAWWHYVSGWPFRALGLRLDRLTIDLLALAGLALSAMSIAYSARFGRHMLIALVEDNVGSKRDMLDDSYGDGMTIGVKSLRGSLVAAIVVLCLTYLVVRFLQLTLGPKATPYWIAAFLLGALYGWVQDGVEQRWPPVARLMRVPMFPAHILGTIGVIAMRSERMILRFCGALAALLVLSALFRMVVDPYVLPWLEHIPQPPTG